MLAKIFSDTAALFVLVVVAALIGVAARWVAGNRRHFDALRGGLDVLRKVGRELPDAHPIRRRLEAAPVVEVSFEEIAHLLGAEGVGAAAHALLSLRRQLGWIERFAQLAVHLGILGTVFALVTADFGDPDAFRTKLPIALGTTLFGLIGAVVLSLLAGVAESVLERATGAVRDALLAGFDAEKEERG